jgi:hypothetical protein
MDYLSLCLQIERMALSQYANYDFNSMCEFNGAYIGANESGIFTLDSGDLDNTSLIEAFFELPTSDFGIENQKRIRSFYIGYETNGELLLTVKDDDDNQRSWLVPVIHLDEKQHTVKVNGSRSGKGRYWMIRIENLAGADFSIDSISVLPILLNRKPSGN